jgi:DNA-binding MarR family transcriptional regulator
VAQPNADALIVHFLSYVRVARGAYIGRYMAKAWQIRRSTTHNALQRLVKAGRIERVRRGVYQGK